MTQTVTCSWKEKMAFESEVTGHKIRLDAEESVGGENSGPRPKALLLSALAGCTGMDVISILRKMKMEPSFFNLRVEAEMTDEHPKIYNKIRLVYEFKASDELDEHKVETAVGLSQEKYCGVSAMLREAADLTYEIEYI